MVLRVGFMAWAPLSCSRLQKVFVLTQRAGHGRTTHDLSFDAHMRLYRLDIFVLVAIETHRIARFLQQFWHVGLMWIVAGKAVIDCVVGEFGLRRVREIIVAIPAQCMRRSWLRSFLLLLACGLWQAMHSPSPTG